jgi:hypothetical protein
MWPSSNKLLIKKWDEADIQHRQRRLMSSKYIAHDRLLYIRELCGKLEAHALCLKVNRIDLPACQQKKKENKQKKNKTKQKTPGSLKCKISDAV